MTFCEVSFLHSPSTFMISWITRVLLLGHHFSYQFHFYPKLFVSIYDTIELG